MIQKLVSEVYRGNIPKVDMHQHIEQCLDTMLQDVTCNADDLPWYVVPVGD